jgi:hypothetical protein
MASIRALGIVSRVPFARALNPDVQLPKPAGHAADQLRFVMSCAPALAPVSGACIVPPSLPCRRAPAMPCIRAETIRKGKASALL